MFDDDNDPFYDMNAAADYKREAYGDPCPAHGTLRWGGDCGRCQELWEAEAAQAEADMHGGEQ
jgi:hypothetical protein